MDERTSTSEVAQADLQENGQRDWFSVVIPTIKLVMSMSRSKVITTVDGVPCLALWCYIYRALGSSFLIGL